ncbi:polysaccharide deacetylase family protein [Vibrio fortis]|uniref:hypothetical protein n=1 Tax=Vibrio fortis TaxID=212667 RepID=UPI0021C4253C|nr:hypothetical protein [Vibrio fortis]
MSDYSVLTFDYELFLGSSTGSVKNSLIKPTDRIIDIFQKYNARGIFYVDAGYLLKLKEYNSPDLDLIKNQLRTLIDIGSSVELHIHPQWIDAELNEGVWTFTSFDKFRLHSLERSELTSYFIKCKDTLEELTGKKVRSFRAGGWCLQPFEHVVEAFEQAGIELDSSVTPGLEKNNLPHHFFDFRGVDNRGVYRFENDPCVEVLSGNYQEMPVTTHKLFGVTLLINAILLKFYDNQIFGDGRGLYQPDTLKNKFFRIFKTNIRTLSVEGLFPLLFNRVLKVELNKNRNPLCLVMHPKTLTELSLRNMEYICKITTTLNIEKILDKD